MTQDEIISMAREAGSIDSEDVILTVYAAFAAHEREKLAEQEPVAWRWSESNGERWFDWRTDWTKHDEAIRLGFKVEYAYAAPVRTKDLTDDEIEEIGKSYFDEWSFGFARAVIAADREKNK